VKDQSTFIQLQYISSIGTDIQSQPELPPIVDIQSGVNHFLMLDNDGKIWEMGITSLGQRVSQRLQKNYLIPRRSPFLSSQSSLHFTHICCGSYFNLAISRTGNLYTWGQNNWLQCGIATKNEGEGVDLPTKGEFADDIKVKSVAAGEHFAIALDQHGHVWSWGRNASRTLGRETEIPPRELSQNFDNEALPDLPQQVPNLPKIKSVCAGSSHWFALTFSNRLLVYGINTEFRTGIGEETEPTTYDPTTVFDQRNLLEHFEVIAAVGGCQHSLFHLRRIIMEVGSKRGLSSSENPGKKRKLELS